MNITGGDIVAILGGLAGIIMAIVALRKADSESFVSAGRAWRELLEETSELLDKTKKQLDRLEGEVVQLEKKVTEMQELLRNKDEQIAQLTNENEQLKER